ncbi:MAG: hypothetical protein AB4041_10045 [Microcystaceae cyanobacterium]
MVNSGLSAPLDKILEEARLKIAIAKERINDLSIFGIDQQWIEQFEEDIETAVSFPIYEEQIDNLKQLTTAKDAKLTECMEWGQKLRLRIELATKQNQLTNVNFPSNRWTEAKRNESKLIRLFPALIGLAKTYAEVLAKVGQTTEEIETGEQLLDDLIKANQTQEEYKIKRTQVTSDRRVAYRKLYDGVNTINKVGQTVYADNPSVALLFASSWSSSSSSSDTENSE